jgi:hypothetical protein
MSLGVIQSTERDASVYWVWGTGDRQSLICHVLEDQIGRVTLLVPPDVTIKTIHQQEES